MPNNKTKDFIWNDILEVEDSLQSYDIFSNGFTGRAKANPDSYGTIVSFTQLDKWMNGHTFSKELIIYCITYWMRNPNVQPPLRLIALTVRRKKFPTLLFPDENPDAKNETDSKRGI